MHGQGSIPSGSEQTSFESTHCGCMYLARIQTDQSSREEKRTTLSYFSQPQADDVDGWMDRWMDE